jgi:hypothetical protein
MAAHSIGEGSDRHRCPGYGKQHLEEAFLNQAEPVLGRQVGERTILIHNTGQCKGEGCAFHNPSDHHMIDWSMNYRWETGVLERFCPHGVGHPDPDDTAWHVSQGRTWTSIHGCDGCCSSNPENRRTAP